MDWQSVCIACGRSRFESLKRHMNYKTRTGSSAANAPQEIYIPCHCVWGTLKDPHCSMGTSVEYRSKYQPFASKGDVVIIMNINSREGQ